MKAVNPIRILIVEDQMAIAMDIEQRLLAMGYQVVGIALTATEARALLQQEPVDVILLDIHLGDGQEDGIELAAALQQRQLPYIFLTAFGDASTFSRALRLTPSGYVLKPFRDDDLERQIRLAVAKHDQERATGTLNTLYEQALFNTAEPTVVLNNERHILRMNKSMERLCGYRSAELEGCSASNVFTITSNGELLDLLHRNGDRVLQSGQCTIITAIDGTCLGFFIHTATQPEPSGDQVLPDAVFIREKSQLLRIALTEILWLEALDNYTRIHTTGRRYTVKWFLKDVVKQLPVQQFVRIHRSFAVAVTHISSLEEDTLYMGTQALPIGKQFRSELMKRLAVI